MVRAYKDTKKAREGVLKVVESNRSNSFKYREKQQKVLAQCTRQDTYRIFTAPPSQVDTHRLSYDKLHYTINTGNKRYNQLLLPLNTPSFHPSSLISPTTLQYFFPFERGHEGRWGRGVNGHLFLTTALLPPKIPVETPIQEFCLSGGLSNLRRRERHGVAELLEPVNMVKLNPIAIALVKIICPQISVRFLRPQDVVNNNQHFVG